MIMDSRKKRFNTANDLDHSHNVTDVIWQSLSVQQVEEKPQWNDLSIQIMSVNDSSPVFHTSNDSQDDFLETETLVNSETNSSEGIQFHFQLYNYTALTYLSF